MSENVATFQPAENEDKDDETTGGGTSDVGGVAGER